MELVRSSRMPAKLDVHWICDNRASTAPPESQGLAGHQAALAHAPHPYLQLVTEPSRAFLRADHGQGHPPQSLVQRQATRAAHRPLHLTHYANSQPSKWTTIADSILENLHRLCSPINGTGH
ncbi:hypothetical protein C8239_14845 [Paracidovorax avenae]|nr:hypothetical protein C8239_14845 [Paracidovorax avenae]